MTRFEQAFSDGERQAFLDRKNNLPRRMHPQGEMRPYGEAWWLGYEPRSLAWAIRTPPVKPYTEVKEA